MFSFWYIYILILGISIISVFIYKKMYSCPKMISCCAQFYLIYYFVICFFRTIVGNGNQYLGTSFVDKNSRAYIKAGILSFAVLFLLILFLKVVKDSGHMYVGMTVGIFAMLCLLYTVLVDLPRMKVTVILGFVSLFIGALFTWNDRAKRIVQTSKDNSSRNRYIEIGAPIAFFCSLFLLTGPLELFAYNRNDFVFNLNDFLPYMLIYAFFMVVFSVVLLSEYVPERLANFTRISIFIYCVCSYIQQMFLNGDMNEMEGNAQHWSLNVVVVNTVLWGILIVLGVILCRTKKKNQIITYVSAFIAGVQIITFITILLTGNVIGNRNQQLVETDNYVLSPNENLVVFILDAYDTQMLDKVLEDDSSYLEPLHDFTYYTNMTSRYAATDGSMPYLLTGRIAEEEETYMDIYNKSTFLKDIKEYGYDINVLTAAYYIEPFEAGIVDNITEDYFCTLDFEKTVSQMTKCVRYRSAPFIVKPYYYYENYHLTNIIYDTDVYLFGTDADFYAEMYEKGIDVDSNVEHQMQVYHLYGAHAPYYLTEDAQLNYESNPIAQWKGSLRIVYDYIEKLKEQGLYDSTSIIIMADHGLNRSQRVAMDEWNISVSDKSNPIFFVKKCEQKQEQLVINDTEVSHDDFFGTVIKLIDEENDRNGTAVWEQ